MPTGASLVAYKVKHLPAMQETRVQSLGQEVPLEKEMAPHSSILAWEIPWTEELGGLQSMGSQRVRHNGASKQQRRLPFGLWGSRKETTAAVLLQRVAPPGPFRPRGCRKLPCRVLALNQSDFIFLPDLPHSTTFFWQESRAFSGTWSFLALGLCYFHC